VEGGAFITVPLNLYTKVGRDEQSDAMSHMAAASMITKPWTAVADGSSALTPRDDTVQIGTPLKAGSAMMTRQNGRSTAFSLQQQQQIVGPSGITLHQLRDDGRASRHDLILLPNNMTLENSHATLLAPVKATTLSNSASSSQMETHLLINKKAQETYLVEEASSSVQLPLLISRTLKSVPVTIEKRALSEGEDSHFESKARKRFRDCKRLE
jgi:hypothetical protein